MTDLTSSADRSPERPSPLDLLNERLRRLRETGSGTGPLATSQDRLNSMLEKLIDHADRSETRMNELNVSVARTEATAETRLSEAMQAIGACIDAVEKAPKVTLNLIRTVSTRLDQIETRLPTLIDTATQPLSEAIGKLEGRLDAMARTGTGEGFREDLAGLSERLERIAGAIGGFDQSALERVETRLATLTGTTDGLSETLTTRFDRLTADLAAGPSGGWDDAIGRLTDQIADWRTAMARHIDGVASELGAKIETCAQTPALDELGARVDQLGSRISAVADSIDPEAAIQPLKKTLAELTRKVQAHKPVSLDGVESELKAILGRLDQDPAPALDPAMFERISHEIAVVQTTAQAQSREIAEIRGLFETTGQHSRELGLVARGVSDLREQMADLAQTIAPSIEAVRSLVPGTTDADGSGRLDDLARDMGDTRRDVTDLRAEIQASELRLTRALKAQGAMIEALSARLAAVLDGSAHTVSAAASPTALDLATFEANADTETDQVTSVGDEPADTAPEMAADEPEPEPVMPFVPPPAILRTPLRLKAAAGF